MLRLYDIIRKKRDGLRLEAEEIRGVIEGYTRGTVPDYQMAALTMAVFLKGLDDTELGVWTRAMMESGRVLDLSSIPGPKVDKHSTGGVGDKVSICLAPLVAACGVYVPMISGRGLGHTGGTLDKLEAIPGFRVDLDPERFIEVVRRVGACMIGQTSDLAPADRKLYALRDVTATVDSIPLISASILCKKLAEGIDALVLDVKTGSGAFMKTREQAVALATKMVAIGREMGRNVEALITDMDQPLGRAAGNALETMEAIEVLRGRGPEDLIEVTWALGATMLRLAGVVATDEEGRRRLDEAVRDGSGLDRFRAMVEAQGGNPAVADDPDLFPKARRTVVVRARRSGFVQTIDTEQAGISVLLLGAGRERVDATVDPAVGAIFEAKVGQAVRAGDPLVTLHVNDESRLGEAVRRMEEAYRIGVEAPVPRPLIHGRVTAAGLLEGTVRCARKAAIPGEGRETP